ncbi:MAG: hypothetical protein FWG39_02385 [Alphaproteobacteria bacterium]|nr:hypothetical protein [Alphaproteobacteria bacterium]
MQTIILLLSVVIVLVCGILYLSWTGVRKTKNMEKLLARQTGLLAKMQENFRGRNSIDAIAQNAEIIYQDLLQHISPVARAAGTSLRESEQHQLWRTLGGIIDEYSKNPYVLETLRKLIKLDSDIARGADAFLARSEKLLRHLAASDPDGLLASTFADGLLGQTMTLLSQAKQLAQN